MGYWFLILVLSITTVLTPSAYSQACAPSRVTDGTFLRTFSSSEYLMMSEPTLNSELIAKFTGEYDFIVVGESQCVDATRWVQVKAGESSGWLIEYSVEGYEVYPIDPTILVEHCESMFSVGDIGERFYSDGPYPIFAKPDTDAYIVEIVTPDILFTALGETTCEYDEQPDYFGEGLDKNALTSVWARVQAGELTGWVLEQVNKGCDIYCSNTLTATVHPMIVRLPEKAAWNIPLATIPPLPTGAITRENVEEVVLLGTISMESTLPIPNNTVYFVSADSKTLMTTFQAWDLASGQAIPVPDSVAIPLSEPLTLIRDNNDRRLWRIVDVITQEVIFEEMTNHNFYNLPYAFSANKRYMAYAQEVDSVFVTVLLDLVAGEIVWRSERYYYEIYTLSFSPDSKVLAVASADGQSYTVGSSVVIWDVESHQLLQTHDVGVGRGNGLIFSPDTTKLLWLTNDFILDWINTLYVIDLPTGEITHSDFDRYTSNLHIPVSFDGSLMLLNSEGNNILLVDTATGEIIKTLTGSVNQVDNITFTPDGKYLITSSSDDTMLIWGIEAE